MVQDSVVKSDNSLRPNHDPCRQEEALEVRKEMNRVKNDAPWLFKGGAKGFTGVASTGESFSVRERSRESSETNGAG